MCRGGIDAFAAAGKLSAKGAAAVVGGKAVIQVSEGWRKGLSSDAKGERNPTTVRVGTVFFLSGRRCRFSMRRAGLTQRQRQHCISEILAIMERAEILMDRSKNNQSLKIS